MPTLTGDRTGILACSASFCIAKNQRSTFAVRRHTGAIVGVIQ